MIPAGSTHTPSGALRLAAIAGPPSPAYAAVPLPATVVMIPGVPVGTPGGRAATLRIRWFPVSAMYRLPAPSAAAPCGNESCAVVAGPPSPLYAAPPAPAKKVTVPAGVSLRIRLDWRSTIYTLSDESTVTP